MTREPTSPVSAPLSAGLIAICIAMTVYTVALTVSQALTVHTVQLSKSLIAAPLIEELFFRGVVQSGLRARSGFWGRAPVAIGVTAACFAVAHLAATSTVHTALVLAPALVIGWAYERTRSIPLCVALHSAANAAWIFYWSV